MSLYEKYFLPKLLDCCCGMEGFQKKRAQIIPRAHGRVLEIGIGIAKRPVFSMLAYLAGITVTFGGLQFFIFYFGIIGVPLAVFLGVSVKVLISANLAQRVYPIRWDFLSIAGFTGGAIFSWSLAYWFFLMNNQSSFYVILFFSMLVYMVLTAREIKLLKSAHLMKSVS